MKNNIVLFLVLLICACNINKQSEDDERQGNWVEQIEDSSYCNLLENQIKQISDLPDSFLLGYRIGASSKQINDYTEKLIKMGEVSSLKVQVVPTYVASNLFPRYDTIRDWKGFNFNFQINETQKCDGFINFSFHHDSLSHLRYFLLTEFNMNIIRDFLQMKYGLPTYLKYIPETSKSFADTTFVWLSGRKEIQLRRWTNHCYIQYSDVVYRFKEEKNNLLYIRNEQQAHILQKQSEEKEILQNKQDAKKAINNF